MGCLSVLYGTAVLCGFVFADFGSGVFHWATDNYGSDKTPVLGGVIAAFQVKTHTTLPRNQCTLWSVYETRALACSQRASSHRRVDECVCCC